MSWARWLVYVLAPALCRSLDLSGLEPVSISDHCWTSFNFEYHYSAGGAGGFVGMYRTGDPLQACFFAMLGGHINTQVLIDGEEVRSTDYRSAYVPRGDGSGHYWLDLRLWVEPGAHTLLVLFLPARQYFERHFSTAPRERLRERLRALAPEGPPLSPRISVMHVRQRLAPRHCYLDPTTYSSGVKLVPHGS
jgi:hypothetical protein